MFARATAPSLTDLVDMTDARSLLRSAVIPQPALTIPGDDTTTATVEIGETVYNTLDYAGDRDWFRLDLTAGDIVTISLFGTDHDTANDFGALEDPYLTVYDSDGDIVASNDDYYSLDSLLTFAADETATYFVEVAAYSDIYTGDYGLSVEEVQPPEDYVAGDTGTDAVLGANDYVLGSLETPGDSDWYEMELGAFSQVYIDVYGWDHDWENGLGDLADPIIRIYDSNGSLLAEDTSGYSYYSYLYFSTTQADTYYVEVASTSGGVGDFEIYTYGNTSSYEGEIGKRDFVTGAIDTYGEADIYSIEMNAGDTVRVVLKGRDVAPFNTIPDLYDPELTIFDDEGNVLAYNDDQLGRNTLDSALIFTASETGTYYIQADALGGYDIGEYVLRTFELRNYPDVAAAEETALLDSMIGADAFLL